MRVLTYFLIAAAILLAKPTSAKRTKTDYLVVCGKSVHGPYHLRGAKGKLAYCGKLKKTRSNNRIIFAVRGGRVQGNFRRVGTNNKRQIGGKKNGFDTKWKNGQDVHNMFTLAREYWTKKKGDGNKKPSPKPKGKREYLVVMGDVVRGPYHLRGAKGVLKHASKQPKYRRLARAIYEVRNNVVLPNPRTVGGQNQAAGTRTGFFRHWRGTGDIKHMYIVAKGSWERYIHRHRGGPKPVQLKFVVVSGKSAKGLFSLRDAKRRLNRFPKRATKPSRAIFEVRNNVVGPDPHTVGYQYQGRGPAAGFNKYWRNWNDINRMYRIAKQFVTSGSKPKPAPSLSPKPSSSPSPSPSPKPLPKPTSKFIVVAGRTAKGPFTLPQAKRELRRYRRASRIPSRAVFEVRRGKVLKDPHTVGGQNQGAGPPAGFNKYWKGWGDISRMYRIANRFFKNGFKPTRPGPKPRTCPCRTDTSGEGKCYYFTDNTATYCKARACAPKHICVARHTGITCIYRRVRSKIVPSGDDDGTCKTKRMRSHMYVPYAQ